MGTQRQGNGQFKPKQKEMVMYQADSAELKIGADNIRAEVTNKATGRIEVPSYIIQFYGHIYKTDNPHEQKVIEETLEFEQGKIRQTTQEEYNQYLTRFNDVSKMPASDMKKMNEMALEKDAVELQPAGEG